MDKNIKIYIPAGNIPLPQNPAAPYLVFDKYGTVRKLADENITVVFESLPIGGDSGDEMDMFLGRLDETDEIFDYGIRLRHGKANHTATGWQRVTFDAPFDVVPTVVASPVDYAGTAQVRIQNISQTGFDFDILTLTSETVYVGASSTSYTPAVSKTVLTGFTSAIGQNMCWIAVADLNL